MDILWNYLVAGIVKVGGDTTVGQKCYSEIPKHYHITVLLAFSLLYMLLLVKLRHHQRRHNYIPQQSRTKGETVFGLLCLSLQMINFYWKSQRGNLLYFVEHCYIADLGLIVLLLWPKNTEFMQRLHSLWTAWVFGTVLYFFVPIHWGDSTTAEIYISEVWHLLVCLGPFVLKRRYGFIKPTIANHFAFFASVGLYHYLVEGSLALLTGVNLNAQLCHLPGDVLYELLGYHSYIANNMPMFMISLVTRIAYFGIFKVTSMATKKE